MNSLWTLGFWKDAGERAIKTFVQTLAAALFVSGTTKGIEALPWLPALSVSASAMVLSMLTSVASLGVGNSGTASLTSAVEPAQ